MALSRRWALIFVLAALMPFLAFAQEEDTLRSTIRADIMSDPRSSEMSPMEIDALVNALATQAEAQGVAQDYLESQNSFDYAVEPPVYEESTSLNPTAIAILALVIVVGGVALFLIWQRNVRRSMPPSAGMVA